MPVQAWSWGSNNRGQLGDGTINYSNVPVKVRGLPPDIVSIAAGGSHVLALQGDGRVWAWGNDDSGQLGVKTPVCRKEYGPVPCARTPLRIPTLHDVVAISAGGDDSLALERNGTVWNWGANGNAQLGSDPGEQAAVQPIPTRITRLSRIVAIATSGHESAAVRRDGTLWAWGEDNADLETTASDPARANGPAPVPGLTHVVAVAGGTEFLVALRQDGTVWTWGNNGSGELGNGHVDAVVTSHHPAPVHSLHDIVAIAAKGLHVLALGKDGTVWEWGWLAVRRCCTPTPLRVPGLHHIRAVVAGEYDDAALQRDGTLWMWGANDTGQLGIGGGDGVDAPVVIRRLTNVAAMAVGYDSSFALQAIPPRS